MRPPIRIRRSECSTSRKQGQERDFRHQDHLGREAELQSEKKLKLNSDNLSNFKCFDSSDSVCVSGD